ncbi:MAG TPA: Xaa-Pro peptidase family protein [Syntrophorhabdaceae bacterium]|jgi:Xaa-Pro aminopeptidase|nr:Xaa-Pro peptidase family protein [Syntrophorhabdaceae bacterium]HOS05932.1 Xaa-Pro peptidase family protein [Syntrophorhabdaceae bacterium]
MLKSINLCEFTPKEEIEDRIARLKKKMSESGISFAVIIQNVDLFYFTGSLQNGVLFVTIDEKPIFFVMKNLNRAVFETSLEITSIKKEKDVKDILTDMRLLKGKGGMELDVVPVAVFERWKGILDYDEITDISRLIKDIRLIKSPFEIEQIKKSGEIIGHVFGKAKDVIEEGVREIDIDAALIAEGRRMGHQGFLRMRGLNQEMMSCYVTHGYSATMPSGADVPISGVGITPAIGQGASINTIKRNIPVLVDYGGGYNGYVTDETRAFVVGEMKDIFKKAHNVAADIIADAMEFGKEGVNGTEIFMRALKRAQKEKLEDYFMGYGEGKVGFIGHGLGLEINELPVITPRHKMLLQEGMVFAFEPKFIIPGEGAIGIEVDFIVRRHGLERVTDTSIDVVYL